MRTLSDDEPKDYNDVRCVWNANPITIRTPQLASTFELLDEIMASNVRDANRIRGTAVIDAAPALGKTTITTAHARRYHGRAIRRSTVRTPEDHRRLPVVYVPLPAGVPEEPEPETVAVLWTSGRHPLHPRQVGFPGRRLRPLLRDRDDRHGMILAATRRCKGSEEGR